jgi:CRP-like cAMP-binding protein
MVAIDRSLIRELALFRDMDGDELDQLLKQATSRRVPANEVVFEQGAPALEFFVLLHGRLKVTQVTPDGQQVVVRVVNPGDLFGIARALQRQDYPGTATAAVDSIAIVWPMSVWDAALRAHPRLAANAMQVMGQRLQEAHTKLRELATEDVERRVAHAVLRLVQQSGKKTPDGIRIDFPISREDIAQMTGTTLHTVSRILSSWETAGLVEGGRQKLMVKDAHRLQLLAEGR